MSLLKMTDISVSLSSNTDALWRNCFELTNEMNITAPGRRIFPTLEYIIMGLDPSKYYVISMHFEFVDDKKLRFVGGKWTESPSTEEKGLPRGVFHQNGLQLGKDWMDKPLSFDQIRVTNRKSNEKKGPSFVHLFAQHRYIPVLTIYEGDQIVHISKIDYTAFITVTAYHSDALNQLKTDTNPYATGSRLDHRMKRQSASGGAESNSQSTKKMKKEPEPSTSNSTVPSIPSPAPIDVPTFPFLFPTNLSQPDVLLQQFQLFCQMAFPLQQSMNTNQFFPTFFPTPPFTPDAPALDVTPPGKVEPVEPTEKDDTVDA
ncbi:hypothetical protein GCK72_010867 [Caenorhabditis remanei]|uniref:T-box domain-containing protein n=1 Tax=Caenorhabditis remanei TaxID=31234 RepID=E3LWG7_CAERE|nr:hypothetical protein GCK72_010867 [Caenorhabditis remanei]EFO83378.1 hypothetical protein CRE_02888 [Caenorhabditis remanei]KAF1762605.1 hypothetical protein GCK72_010867 [Caenorhabditis remanei]